MLLTNFHPLRELQTLETRFGDVLSSSKRGDLLSDFTPSVNTREGKFAYHIDVDLPGVKKEDIHIAVDGRLLTIRGERHSKEEVDKEDYYSMESSFGSFQRSFTMPDGIDVENIHAEDSEGVLDITLPKTEAITEMKTIDIK